MLCRCNEPEEAGENQHRYRNQRLQYLPMTAKVCHQGEQHQTDGVRHVADRRCCRPLRDADSFGRWNKMQN